MKSRARLRFKAAIRFVLNNLSWIREELEERDDLYARFRHGALRKNVSYTTINTTASEKKIGKKKAGQDSAFPYRVSPELSQEISKYYKAGISFATATRLNFWQLLIQELLTEKNQ